MPTDLKSTLAALDTHEPASLLGLRETQWIDVKRDPYQLADPKAVEELTKDVAGFANGGGGVIVLGLDTRLERTWRRRPSMRTWTFQVLMFSAMDLTARHPRTGELQRELTYDGLRAAEAKGSKGGRRRGRDGRRRAHRVPRRPLHRRPRPRPRRQPRRDPDRRR
ncbi:hypothetical protein ACFRIC_16800 [Streptomyces sp. NPDC056738]|uniref:hypothetical protein n=1 Tax=Streptomyces sp. NPDC056738 TaxID=3345933 RepID=UPI0036B5ECE2